MFLLVWSRTSKTSPSADPEIDFSRCQMVCGLGRRLRRSAANEPEHGVDLKLSRLLAKMTFGQGPLPQCTFRRHFHTADSGVIIIRCRFTRKRMGGSEDLRRVAVIAVEVELLIDDAANGIDPSVFPGERPRSVIKTSIADNDQIAVVRLLPLTNLNNTALPAVKART